MKDSFMVSKDIRWKIPYTSSFEIQEADNSNLQQYTLCVKLSKYSAIENKLFKSRTSLHTATLFLKRLNFISVRIHFSLQMKIQF